jgi:hypothetical protein
MIKAIVFYIIILGTNFSLSLGDYGEIVISKRRTVETENVEVDAIREQIKIQYADGRKEKITD